MCIRDRPWNACSAKAKRTSVCILGSASQHNKNFCEYVCGSCASIKPALKNVDFARRQACEL
eukprot:13333181-Alexandrium_andersonii.AAC.1